MPHNLEIKARLGSLVAARETALSIGAQLRRRMVHVDTYFCAASGRLKLREIDSNEAELIYYAREEKEERRISAFERVAVADPGSLKLILASSMGIRGVVTKKR